MIWNTICLLFFVWFVVRPFGLALIVWIVEHQAETITTNTEADRVPQAVKSGLVDNEWTL